MVETVLATIGLVILVGFTGRLAYKWSKIPEALFLILLGIFFGPVAGIVDAGELLAFAPLVAVLALILVLFEAGMSFDVFSVLKTFKNALAFTLLVAITSTLIVGAFLHYFFGWSILHALLVGLFSSGTTTVTTMALLSQMNVGKETKRLLTMETIINDFTLIIGTLFIIEIIKYSSSNSNAFLPAIKSTGAEMSVGLLVGAIFVFIWGYILTKVNFRHDLNYISTLGWMLIMYYFSALLGGSPLISVFTFSLLLGNIHRLSHILKLKEYDKPFRRILISIQTIQKDISFFAKAFFFFLIGVIFNFHTIDLPVMSIIAGIILCILAARAFSSELLCKVQPKYCPHKFIITTMIPRGFVATVLAFLPSKEGIIIPRINEIILLLVIATTLFAIASSYFYEKRISNRNARHENTKK